MAYLYTPPTWSFKHMFPGAWALRYGIDTYTITYKDSGGTWHNIQDLAEFGGDVLKDAIHVFTLPTIVDSATATELQAFGVGTVTTV